MSDVSDRESNQPIVPAENDVLLGRGREISTWEGNKRYLVEIERNANIYGAAKTRNDRVRIVLNIIESIQTRGRFLDQSQSEGKWYLADMSKTRKKVGQALRYQLEQLRYDTARRQSKTPPSSSSALSSSSKTEATTGSTSLNATSSSIVAAPVSVTEKSTLEGAMATDPSNNTTGSSSSSRPCHSSSDEKEKGGNTTTTTKFARPGQQTLSPSTSDSSFGIPLSEYGDEEGPPILTDQQILRAVGVDSVSIPKISDRNPIRNVKRGQDVDAHASASQATSSFQWDQEDERMRSLVEARNRGDGARQQNTKRQKSAGSPL